MRSIWKFELEILDEQTILMPEVVEWLDTQVQRNKICVWAVVETGSKKTAKRFFIKGTGHPFPEHNETPMVFLNTVQLDGGDFAFHVFLGDDLLSRGERSEMPRMSGRTGLRLVV